MIVKKKYLIFIITFFFLGCSKKTILLNKPFLYTNTKASPLKQRVLVKLNNLVQNQKDNNAKVLLEFFNWNLAVSNLDTLYYLNTEGYGVVIYNFESLKTNKYQNGITDNEFKKMEEMINIKFETISSLSKNHFPNTKGKRWK